MLGFGVMGLIACGQPDSPLGANQSAVSSDFTPGQALHFMPMGTQVPVAGPAFQAPSGAHLSYSGGPVISNVKVMQVLWGSGTYQSAVTSPQMGNFYQQATNSAWMDWLSEYNTSSQSIGRGSFVGQVQINPSNSKTALADLDVQRELSAQMSAGHLAPPDGNTLYMVNFPKGFSISDQGRSCVLWCAYHGSFTQGRALAYYGVIPDFSPGSGCDTGCGSSSNPTDNLTMVESHELAEAVTDPEVEEHPAWNDSINGEIGDICVDYQGTFLGTDGYPYGIQSLFSNQASQCIVNKSTTSPDFGVAWSTASVSLAQGSSTSLTVTTTDLSGVSPTIDLSIVNLPAGGTATLSQTSVTAGGSATVTLSVDKVNSQPGTSTVMVWGADPSGYQTGQLALTVTAAK
jgi:hypothetical protein